MVVVVSLPACQLNEPMHSNEKSRENVAGDTCNVLGVHGVPESDRRLSPLQSVHSPPAMWVARIDI